jgi:RNA polymerase sigma-70 factor (ECF subfamily)
MEPRQRTSDEGRSWYRSVYDAHATQLLAYFLRRVAEDHAHDLVAEVFLTAWRRRESAPDEPDLRPWLFKVARNVLRNHRRGTARRRQLHERLRSHAMTETAADPPPDSADISARLRWALNRLREPDREILQLAAWEECTTSELATVLGWSANAAAVRLHRARRRLRKVLAEASAVSPGAAATAAHRVDQNQDPRRWSGCMTRTTQRSCGRCTMPIRSVGPHSTRTHASGSKEAGEKRRPRRLWRAGRGARRQRDTEGACTLSPRPSPCSW